MANIVITLPAEEQAFTGKQVTFTAPCDCSTPEGLVIGEQTFSIVDAAGNDILGVAGAFTQGALLTVILDCDNLKAYLQNEAIPSNVKNHISNTSNPHAVTKSQIGLGNVENKSSATIRGEITSSNVTTALGYTPLKSALKGANSGLAELDENGKVPTSQLPSYVDDVIECADASSLPTTGETGKIYINLATNKQYRWSGSTYVEISPSIALGETSATAYRGDRGKVAYEHSTKTSGNPHGVTASDVGLGNVPNVSTNNQTPTYTVASSNTALTSGEKLSVAMGKIAKAVNSLISHLANEDNPHNVCAEQLGLENVSNTSDLDKPISTATQTALDTKRTTRRIVFTNSNYSKIKITITTQITGNYGMPLDLVEFVHQMNGTTSEYADGQAKHTLVMSGNVLAFKKAFDTDIWEDAWTISGTTATGVVTSGGYYPQQVVFITYDPTITTVTVTNE